jgi:hypothetical protein
MAESDKEIFKEVGRRTLEQVKNAGYFLGGLAVFETGVTVLQATDAAGDIVLAAPTMAVGALIAIKGGEKILEAGLRPDFNKKISDRNT